MVSTYTKDIQYCAMPVVNSNYSQYMYLPITRGYNFDVSNRLRKINGLDNR